MKNNQNKTHQIFRNETLNPKKILISMIVLSIPYALIGMNFILIKRSDFFYILFQFIITFITLFLIPAILLKYKWHIKLNIIGTKKGNIKLGLIFLIISIIAIPAMYIGSIDKNLQQTYPLAQDWFRTFSTNPNWFFFIIYEILYGVLYYIPYEFFWRGVVQLGLSNYWNDLRGKWKSIIIVTIVTTILHATKPISEIIGAFFIGFLFGYIAYKTDSWYYVFGIHYLIGISNDVFCGLRILGII